MEHSGVPATPSPLGQRRMHCTPAHTHARQLFPPNFLPQFSAPVFPLAAPRPRRTHVCLPPPPRARDAQAAHRAAVCWVQLWRPPYNCWLHVAGSQMEAAQLRSARCRMRGGGGGLSHFVVVVGWVGGGKKGRRAVAGGGVKGGGRWHGASGLAQQPRRGPHHARACHYHIHTSNGTARRADGVPRRRRRKGVATTSPDRTPQTCHPPQAGLPEGQSQLQRTNQQCTASTRVHLQLGGWLDDSAAVTALAAAGYPGCFTVWCHTPSVTQCVRRGTAQNTRNKPKPKPTLTLRRIAIHIILQAAELLAGAFGKWRVGRRRGWRGRWRRRRRRWWWRGRRGRLRWRRWRFSTTIHQAAAGAAGDLPGAGAVTAAISFSSTAGAHRRCN